MIPLARSSSIEVIALPVLHFSDRLVCARCAPDTTIPEIHLSRKWEKSGKLRWTEDQHGRKLGLTRRDFSDILHPNRANISKDELREKLGGLYKAQKDQISVFGLRTQYGGGKTTGFALVYDSPEAMKKFEPQYRLVRVGLATKAERASRQQRASLHTSTPKASDANTHTRQAAQEPTKDPPRNGKGQGCQGEEGQISDQQQCLCISSGWLLGSCGIVHSAASRPSCSIRRREVQGPVAGGRALDSARGGEGLAFTVSPQYTSMKSMVFRVSDQKNITSLVIFRVSCFVMTHLMNR